MPTRRSRPGRRPATANDSSRWSEALNLVHQAHAEIYTHSRTGETIRMRCDCSIGRDHTYEEWLVAEGAPLPDASGTPDESAE